MSEQRNCDQIPKLPPLIAEPATVEACKQDRDGHDITCEGAARDQFAFTRINAAGGRS